MDVKPRAFWLWRYLIIAALAAGLGLLLVTIQDMNRTERVTVPEVHPPPDGTSATSHR